LSSSAGLSQIRQEACVFGQVTALDTRQKPTAAIDIIGQSDSDATYLCNNLGVPRTLHMTYR